MNLHVATQNKQEVPISSAEWEARVDLAAVYRLVERLMQEGLVIRK